MEQKIMSFRLSRSGRRAIALNNQRCRFRRARAPVAKRVLVPVAALSLWNFFKPKVSDSSEVDAPESSSTAKLRNTKSLKNKFWGVFRRLKESAQRFSQRFFPFKGRERPVPKSAEGVKAIVVSENGVTLQKDAANPKRPVPMSAEGVKAIVVSENGVTQQKDAAYPTLPVLENDEDNREAAAVKKQSYIPQNAKTSKLNELTILKDQFEDRKDAVTIVDLLNRLPIDRRSEMEVTKELMLCTLWKLMSENNQSRTPVRAIWSAMDKVELCDFKTVPDYFIDSIAKELKVSPSLFYASQAVSKEYMIYILCKLQSEGRLTTPDQMREATFRLNSLKKSLGSRAVLDGGGSLGSWIDEDRS